MRRCLCFALALASLHCSSDDTAADRRTVHPAHAVEATPASPAAPEAGAVALTANVAESYFQTGRAKAASEAFALERWAEAEKGFLRAAQAESTAPAKARALLMAGLAQTLQQKWQPALKNLDAGLPELPLLADYIHYQMARALYFNHDNDAALEHAMKVDADSIVAADAELLAGDILRAQGKTAAVARHYQSYLERRPKGIRLSEARFRQAEAIESLVESSVRPAEHLREAVAAYREITVTDPLSSWAERAQAALDAMAKKSVPADVIAAIATPLSAEEHITRGMALYDAMRNPESEAEFEAALKAPGIDADKRCVAAYHRANSVFKARQRQRAAPLFDEALADCKKTGNADLQVKSAYQAGRSYANTGEHEKAVTRYATAEKLHPEHSYADDARLRQAEEYRDLGDEAQETKLLSSIPRIYPDGDMRAEAMWRLAWRAIKKDDFKEAIGWLRKQIATKPIDDNYWAEGQAQYWLGRCHAQLGQTDDSIRWYRETIKTYPLSYYSLLALNRLREKHTDVFRAVVEEISASAPNEATAPRFKPRAIYGSEGFKRAMEFLRLGLGSRAEAELRKLGLSAPAGKSRVDDKDDIDRIWAMAYLYDRAGRYEHSHWVTRWHVLDYKRFWPNKTWRTQWDIAYPRAWWPLLDKWAQRRGHPTELQISFVREESAFDPLRESFANAIGLTQMIFSTANRFAKGTGIKVSRETLRDPEMNVTIGSNFLSFLMNRFEQRVALVVPSYNAGEGATFRWLRERGDWPQDEWSEEIPYDETRNYAKRVISSYFTYSFLGKGTIPEMPNDIPKSVLPK